MRTTTKVIALLNAALVLTGIGAAQTITPSNPTTPPSQLQDANVPSHPVDTQSPTIPQISPVFWISSVEVMRSSHAPQLDVVRVRGLVTSEGWEGVELVPMTKGTPADGVLDLALVAESPNDSATPSEYAEVEAIFAIEPGHPFKGVRVHGAANRVLLQALPGYSVSATPPQACADCTGKLFVAKGQIAPASRAATTIVHEEDLPNTLRVIRESDGVGSMDLNPNRLTILLSDKNEILQATWE
jgi:hypothetical protein